MGVELNESVLAEFLRDNQEEILRRWHAIVSARPASSGLTIEQLTDHIPDLIEAIADTGETRVVDPRARLADESAGQHAIERLAEGLDLDQVVIELTVLRDCILQVWDELRSPGTAREEVRFLNRSIDRAITASVERYTEARDRAVRALDRISAAALESRDIDELLQRLLQVLIETTPAIETATVLLREDDDLVVRAAAGLEEDLGRGFRVRIGEGSVGSIAATGRPQLLTGSGSARGAVGLSGRKFRAVYGVPLRHGHRVLGVATIGSLTAADFSDQDKRLLFALSERATAGIAQHMLREAAEWRAAELAAVIESIPDAVLVGDADGIKQANGAALQLLEAKSVGDINDMRAALAEFLELRRPETGESVPPEQRPFARALRGQTVAEEFLFKQRRAGREIVLRTIAAPVRAEGRVVSAVVVASDVTAQRRADGENRRLYQETRAAMNDRQHLMAIVSHDLRNPLNTITMAASLLQEIPPGSPASRKPLESILRSARRMTHLIQDLLDVSSIQAGRLSVDPKPHDPVSVVDEVIESFQSDAQARGLVLGKDVIGTPPHVRADRDRLLQALSNLVSNALKVTHEGSVTVRVRSGPDIVEFGVIDTGPGVPVAEQGKLFEPYWRGENAEYRGTGLGLAIVRGIVEAHGGQIRVESQPGEGAAFIFTLPSARRGEAQSANEVP